MVNKLEMMFRRKKQKETAVDPEPQPRQNPAFQDETVQTQENIQPSAPETQQELPPSYEHATRIN